MTMDTPGKPLIQGFALIDLFYGGGRSVKYVTCPGSLCVARFDNLKSHNQYESQGF